MKLGVCIYKSIASKLSNITATKNSLITLPCNYNVYVFQNFLEINNFLKNAEEDWFLILNDREYLDCKLSAVFNILMEQKIVDGYFIYCVLNFIPELKFIVLLRLIKNGIFYQKSKMLPERNDLNLVKILDGWICEHDTNFNKI